MSETKSKVKLKWYRFTQIVLLPLIIIGAVYTLISDFTDLFGLNLSWTDHSLRNLIEAGGADVYHLGIYFWPVIIILALTLIRLVLALYSWIGSFRMRRYSYRCWLALTTLGLIGTIALIYVIWEYGLNRGGMIQWLAMSGNQQIHVDATFNTVMKIMLILTGLLALLYTVANYIYYGKRKHLFNYNEDLQEPYEDVEDDDYIEEAKPKQPVQSGPFISVEEVKSEEPAAPVETKPAEEVIEPEVIEPEAEELEETQQIEDLSESAAEEEMTEKEVQPEVIEQAEETAEVQTDDEPDELGALLEDTEKAMMEIGSAKTEEPEADPEPAVISLVGEESEPVSVERSMPLQDEPDEAEQIAETQVLETISEITEEAIRYCPDCGAKIPDREMRYCIRCGRKIR